MMSYGARYFCGHCYDSRVSRVVPRVKAISRLR
jgi:hypothetical protein